MLVQHLTGYIPMDQAFKTPDFFDMNLKLSYDFHIYEAIELEVSAGILNLFQAYQSDFDPGKNRDSSYIYGPATPRSFFAGAKISF